MPGFLRGNDGVPDAYYHPALQDTFGCRGWTWSSENNSELQLTCQLFGWLGLPVPYKESVSGPQSCTGLAMSGGYPHQSASNTAEIYLPAFRQHCRLPDIPGNPRWYHTMDITTTDHSDHTMEQIIICGGLWSDSNIRKTCLTLNTTGDWETFAHLLHPRPYHSSWTSPSGKAGLLR